MVKTPNIVYIIIHQDTEELDCEAFLDPYDAENAKDEYNRLYPNQAKILGPIAYRRGDKQVKKRMATKPATKVKHGKRKSSTSKRV